jgi:hypothetical protein
MNNLEGGNEERLRKRMQLVLLGWCTPCGSKERLRKDAIGPFRMVHAVWQQRQLRLGKVFP